jgi:hypothetical protein
MSPAAHGVGPTLPCGTGSAFAQAMRERDCSGVGVLAEGHADESYLGKSRPERAARCAAAPKAGG